MIHLVCAANRDYKQHMCAMLASVILNTTEQLSIHILNNDFLEVDKKYITEMFCEYSSVDLYYYTVKDDILAGINIIAEHLTIQTLYRLLAPILLPKDINKVLYLDCDVIVEDDISKLYAIDLEDYHLAATNELSYEMIKLLELERDTYYFNAGVILINLKKWREEDFWLTCRTYALTHPDKLVYGDQDILNGVLRGNWKRFHLKWNSTTNFSFFEDQYSKHFGIGEVEQAVSTPSIIHYIGRYKPWYVFCSHPYQERYFHYLDEINYSYVKYPELVFLGQQTEKKIVLFGASVAGATNLEKFKQYGVDVAYFCDNSPDKWNTFFNGVKVLSPREIMELENIVIFITSMYVKEISQQLSGLGLVENQDFFELTSIWRLASQFGI
ncbi:glycosyltransferase family 8 protein [Paenibacillus sp. DXFW5]|uniref:Glycosyltransferase family 8 protein n=1 Tax=Paenibacillus rhizolycopersici TaxID=2780073 RepID=A0ABS2H961_9BACL|nr:glycosyltransferase family 8 protein [Paenibacillus rhizolycopersici]MBM6997256.1 glycosyltransferase family 8 protein [Paenibacillus rhizolycopersici]